MDCDRCGNPNAEPRTMLGAGGNNCFHYTEREIELDYCEECLEEATTCCEKCGVLMHEDVMIKDYDNPRCANCEGSE